MQKLGFWTSFSRRNREGEKYLKKMFKEQKGSSWDTNANGVKDDMEVDNCNDENELIDSVCAFCGTEGGLKFETEKLCETMEIKNDLGFCEMQEFVSDVGTIKVNVCLGLFPNETAIWSLWEYVLIKVAQRKREKKESVNWDLGTKSL